MYTYEIYYKNQFGEKCESIILTHSDYFDKDEFVYMCDKAYDAAQMEIGFDVPEVRNVAARLVIDSGFSVLHKHQIVDVYN